MKNEQPAAQDLYNIFHIRLTNRYESSKRVCSFMINKIILI